MIRFRKAWKILGICLVLLVCSCSGKDKSKHINYRLSGENELLEALSALKEAPDDVTLNISIWYYFTERGMWDSVIRYAAPVFHRTLHSPEKEQLMLYAGAYASEAYRLGRLSADHYAMTYSALQLSQMLYLKKEYAAAAAHIDEISGISENYQQFSAQVNLLNANMDADRGYYSEAEKYYQKALETQEHTEPGVMTSISNY